MLTHLTINNFLLIDHLDLQLKEGMTAITGETGTGKSVVLGALAMALGERADGERVRQGSPKADITATFLLDDLPEANQWLIENDLCHGDECLLRRIITSEGRSRAFINAQPVTLQQLKALGELLINVHSQHAQQSLLAKSSHQRLLDDYAQHKPLVEDVQQAFKVWQQLREQFIHLRDNADEVNARYQLLRYQVDELDQLNLTEGELQQLEQEQQTLANAETLLDRTQQVVEVCDSEQGISTLLQQALSVLRSVRPQTEIMNSVDDLLNNALIHVDEANQNLRSQLESVELDPERLQFVENRLSAIYDIARKHHINPDEILHKHQQLSAELMQLSGNDESLASLEAQVTEAEACFMTRAQQLSEQRQAAAQVLSDAINQQLHALAMGNANLLISVATAADKPHAYGIDSIEFLISTNPGQAHRPIAKVVSGGELSRVSLAIAVVTAQTSKVATVVFDEVDVGIGGATADVVGSLLSTLGNNSQVLCVTHLAQVASKAHQHWRVSKNAVGQSAESQIIELSGHTKIEEIARMISGSELSDESVAHARLMVEKAVG